MFCKVNGCYKTSLEGSDYCSKHRSEMLINSKALCEEFLKEFRKKYWESKNLTAPSTDPIEQYWQSKGIPKPADKAWPSALDDKGLPGRSFDPMAPRYKDMSGWFSGDD